MKFCNTFVYVLVLHISDCRESFQRQKTVLNESINNQIINRSKDFLQRMFEQTMTNMSRKVSKNTKESMSIEEDASNYDPTVYLTVPQLIALHDYPSEAHTIITEDGYILTIHRIPYTRNRRKKTSFTKTVLLQHGIVGSSGDWIIAGPQKSLPYILSEAGYDVWLANARGNTYSKAHLSLDVNSAAFWNFTFHEIGQYDLSAVVDYIISVKGEKTKLDYIGHSMGVTVLLALLSTRTEYNNKLNSGIALAPAATLTKVKTPLRYLIPDFNALKLILNLFSINEVMSSDSMFKRLRNYYCGNMGYPNAVCIDPLFLVWGFDHKQFNRSLLPILFHNIPAGGSMKLMMHYAQEYYSAEGRFQMFDYGANGNMLEYGNMQPPEYAVDKITLPITLISAQNDLLVSLEDATKLYKKLPNALEHYVVPNKDFTHIDFLWAIDAPTLVYDKVISSLEKMQSER